MCWNCSLPLDGNKNRGRNDSCPQCGKDFWSCKNCSFFAKGKQYDCNEHIEEPVFEKERRNFCDFFKPLPNLTNTSQKDSLESKKKDFNSLFGD